MNVFITIDVEIWCDSWQTLDADFPRSFERYVFGRSRHGDFGLPKTLEILARHSLKGIFFVEPLFATRFGIEPLATVVDLIQHAGHEIQLHLHPEWTDEARVPLLANVTSKRQHLSYYSLEEQQALIAHGLRLFREVGVATPNAFRAGSFGCNMDTFRAVEANDLVFDSSVNQTVSVSAPDLAPALRGAAPFRLGRLTEYPMSVFRDGFGVLRHAQVGACSYEELRDALLDAQRRGWNDFVLLSHNFELLRVASADPDLLVVKRFERLASFLAEHRDVLCVKGFHDLVAPPIAMPIALPRVHPTSTAMRHGEQLLRRFRG